MKEEQYIKKKELLNVPKSISYEEMKALLALIETHICKIERKDGTHGTGFFCNFHSFKVLMTNNHVINKNDIKSGLIINFSINNHYKDFHILIDDKRKTYINEYDDIAIIEIKKEDGIDENSFFDIKNLMFFGDLINCQTYLLHYPKSGKMEISPGIIINIDKPSFDSNIWYLCDASEGSAGGPIINKEKFELIGIHKGGAEGQKNYNIGRLLKEPIHRFMKFNVINIGMLPGRRIQKESEFFNICPQTHYSAGPINDNDMYNWWATILGPDDSPYEGAVFFLKIEIPYEYPFKHPKCTFTTKIYHPNIDCNGKIDLDILKDMWSPNLTIYSLLSSISFLMMDPNPDDSLVPEIGKIYSSNREEYNRKAKEWAKKYAC